MQKEESFFKVNNLKKSNSDYDAIFVGAGIMSATLAILLTEIYPDIKILILEKLDNAGKESTSAFNNAGTAMQLIAN